MENTKQKIIPFEDRVLLKNLDSNETLAGSIILPASAQEKKEQMEVIAVGAGKTNKDGSIKKPQVKEGNVVIVDKYAGQQVELNDEEYTIVKSDDIIAIIES